MHNTKMLLDYYSTRHEDFNLNKSKLETIYFAIYFTIGETMCDSKTQKPK